MKHLTWSSLLLFSLPSIGMQLVDNTYPMADGYFISNYIGTSAFAAENIIYPPIVILTSIGLMFGNGTSALASYYLGRKDQRKANQLFTSMTALLFLMGLILSAALYVLIPSLARFLGAPENMITSCTEYGRVLAVFMPLQMVSMSFQPMLIAADRPGLGLVVSVVNALLNIFLDFFLVAVLRKGLFGAALATGIAWFFSALIPLMYFFRKTSKFHFTDVSFDFRDMFKAAYNGSSEMIDSVAYAIVAMMFNSQLMKYSGENGVASYAVTEYVSSLPLAVFMGISMSLTPHVGYALGEGNKPELRRIRNTGAVLMGTLGLMMTAAGILSAKWVAGVFVGYDETLKATAVEALIFVSVSYFPLGLTNFSSGFFTGMNDGTFSLMIAASKSFVLPAALLLVLPPFIGIRGIWLTTPVSETAIVLLAVLLFSVYKHKNLL
ncbi:MAG: MATE family efflux transporter [Synergistaceae bacterium]|nr:MATE family efflux transporter [Synergistaceae bacterium]